MKFVQKAIGIALYVAAATTTMPNVSAHKLRGLRVGDGSNNNNDSLLPADVVVHFKKELGLQSDFDLFLQRIQPYGDFAIEGEVFSFTDLTPYSVESDKMETILIDDQEFPFMVTERMFLGKSLASGRSILVITDLEGNVQDIEITNPDESITLITQVFQTGVYATVPSYAYDPTVVGYETILGRDSKEPLNRLLQFQSDHLNDFASFEMDNKNNNNERNLQSDCSSYKEIEIATAFDSSFCAQFGGASGATSEVRRIVATASNAFYRRPDLCVTLKIVHEEGYCTASSDPYNRGAIQSGCNNEGMLDFFQDYWNANRQNVARDTAHLFRSERFTDGSTVGCAYVGVLCNRSSAYGVNDFSTTTTSLSRRATLFGHELGHNANAPHIDSTSSGEYVMEPSVNRGTHGFSSASKSRIRSFIDRSSCIGTASGPTPTPPTPSPPTLSPPTSGGTCGGGSRGNGVCANGECCSQYGWCGTSSAHCSGPTPSPPGGTCGGGSRGNGICANGECCSQYGWCGTSPAHCSASGGTCGNGSRGNGICANGECCSRYGWCGTTSAHCN